MKIQECQVLLADALGCTASCLPEHSPSGKTAASILRMARAYESDGTSFLAREDPVNALAAFLYAFGWLHCGAASGLIGVREGRKPSCPFTGTFDTVPASQFGKRDEKTSRYARLLETALASVSPAPDPATPLHRFAREILFISNIYLYRGKHLIAERYNEDALACFSYGHGWLDTGVQAGLFTIHANRAIFTVD
jgi:uncharacterized protein